MAQFQAGVEGDAKGDGQFACAGADTAALFYSALRHAVKTGVAGQDYIKLSNSGLSNGQIAASVKISPSNVEALLGRLATLSRLGVAKAMAEVAKVDSPGPQSNQALGRVNANIREAKAGLRGMILNYGGNGSRELRRNAL